MHKRVHRPPRVISLIGSTKRRAKEIELMEEDKLRKMNSSMQRPSAYVSKLMRR